MKTIQQELFHRTQTTKDFLFYKTDEKSPAKTRPTLGEFSHENILKKFPDMLAGKAFLKHIQSVLEEKNCFSVMAIGLDTPIQTQKIPQVEKIILVLECINNYCATEKGIWGELESDLFICVFPSKTGDKIQTEGPNLQNRLADKTDQTITIGMASYPLLTYNKEQIIECALKALNHAAFFGPDSCVFFDAVSLNISGDQFYQKGDIDSAVSEYQTALKMDPEDVNVLNSMGVCYAVKGDFDTALSYFESAGRLDPEEVMAWYNCALVYKLKGDRNKALDYFLKAGTKKENTFEIAFQTGKIYFEMGDKKAGTQYYEKALALSQDTLGNQRFIGDCYAALNDADNAMEAYKKAIKENPNDAFALSALGMLYDRKGENPEISEVFCRQSVDIAPLNSLFRRRLALIHLKQDNLDLALEGFKLAERLDSQCDKFNSEKAGSGQKKSQKRKVTRKKSKTAKSVA